MSAFHVVVAGPRTPLQEFPCATWPVAFTIARLAHRDHPGDVRVYSDQADAEYFTDGTVRVNDGLSPEQREMLEEAGVYDA